jgi:lysophospholipase L1-like esterase
MVFNPVFLGEILIRGSIENMMVILVIIIAEIVMAGLGVAFFLIPDFFIKKKKEIALLVIISLFSIFVLEFGTKLIWKSPIGGWYGYPPRLFEPNEKMGYVYTPNFKGYFPNPPYQNIAIEINSKGLRDNEHQYEKQKDVTRILGLGDSITFGAGIPFEKTYLYQLEKKLVDGDHAVEIIKAGVNGYDFDSEYAYFTEEGNKYNPDVVILGLFLNDIDALTPELIKQEKEDIETAQKKEVKGIRTENPRLLDYIKSRCTLCNIVYTIFSSTNKKSERDNYNLAYFNYSLKKKWTEDWSSFQKKLLKFNEELSKKNIKFLIVIFPQTEQFSYSYGLTRFPQEQLDKMGQEYDIDILDLLSYLDTPEYKSLYLLGDSIHPNEAGNIFISNIILETLLNRGIIPK